MAKFDQRGQKVVNQVNAESNGHVNFGAVQNKAELVVELRKILSELNKAAKVGLVKDDIAVHVKSHIKKAISEAEKPEPKKESILNQIDGAKKLLDGITSATGLMTALMQVSKIIGGLFP
jgi:hypothetical protein